MRGKYFFAVILVMLSAFLSGCNRVINSPSDEFRMYSWGGEYDNGFSASLTFDDSNGYLSIENDDYSLDIGGLCIISDDSLIFCDEATGLNYHIDYRLYGDRVELELFDGSVELKKR